MAIQQISYNLPVGAHPMVNDDEKIKVGKALKRFLANLQVMVILQEVFRVTGII
jgi:hypothetical protein